MVFPRGNNNPEHLSVYVEIANVKDLKPGWSFRGSFTLELVNSKDPEDTFHHMSQHVFTEREPDWGYAQFCRLSEVLDKSRGVLQDDCITIVAAFERLPDVPAWGALSGYDSRKETGYVGLRNQGATCYMNSLLQTLYHTAAFTQAVFQLPTEGDEPTKSIPLALQRVFFNLKFSRTAVGTRELTNSFGWDSADSFTQHDVQELNRVLTDKMEEKMKGTPAEGSIARLLSGKIKHSIRCTEIEFESCREETFYDLSLDVKGCKDIVESFQRYTEVEVLDGENKYFAEGHGLQPAKKGCAFLSFPPVLHVQLKRWDYDPVRDCMAKINDRFEFPLVLELDRFLDQSAPHTVPNTYHLHAVLIHSGDVHGGHYYVYIRPKQGNRWFRMDDERVTRARLREVLEDSYGGNREFTYHVHGKKVTSHTKKFSNAYMLMYIRDSDRPQTLFRVRARNIPTHLHDRFASEVSQTAAREKELAEAHLYANIRAITEDHLRAHRNKMDLVVFEDVPAFKVKKTTTTKELRAVIAERLGLKPEKVRLWSWTIRQNRTVRPDTLIPADDKPLDQVTTKSELRVFVETAPGAPDDTPAFPAAGEEDATLFFKQYFPERNEVVYLGRKGFKSGDHVATVVEFMRTLARYAPTDKVIVYEEVRPGMVEPLAPQRTLLEAELGSGDILVIQTMPEVSAAAATGEPSSQVSAAATTPAPAPAAVVVHPTIKDFFDYQMNRLSVRFRLLSKPKTDVVVLELSKKHVFDHVVAKLAEALPEPRPDPAYIRLTGHNTALEQPKWEPFKKRPDLTLWEMLSWQGTMIADVLYYETLELPLAEAEQKRMIKAQWYGIDLKPGEVHQLFVPKTGTVRDVLDQIAALHPSQPGGSGKYRMLEVFNHKLYREFASDAPISSMIDYSYQAQIYRVEEKPLEEQNMTAGQVRLHVVHFEKDINGNAALFGDPFYIVCKKGATVADVKPEIQRRLGVSDEEFAKWKFAIVSYMQPRFVDDKAVVATDTTTTQGGAGYQSYEYFGLYHPDPAPRSRHSQASHGYRRQEKAIKING